MSGEDSAFAWSNVQARDLFDRMARRFHSGATRPIRWRHAQLDALSQMLRDNSAALAHAVHADLGKPAAETALMEIGLVMDEIRFLHPRIGRWAARHPKLMPWLMQPAVGWTLAEPKGVALIISPWNYPLMLTFEPLADAIAAGCCACLKPSELSPNTSALIASLVPRYLDRDAFCVVQGGAAETGMLLDMPFDHVFYTGGGRVGRIVMAAAARHLTPVTLELGGKSPVFVDGTTNLDVAARRIAWGRFINAGQTCVAPDYVLATPNVIDPLTKRVAAAIRRFFGDDPKHCDSYGRIVNERHTRRLAALLPTTSDGDHAIHDGPYVVCGGEVDVAARYVAPTVLRGVRADDPVMQEEIFGPILPIMQVADAREAVDFITSRDRPLAAYVFSRNRGTRVLFERETSSGALGFGLPLGHLASSRLPFGGVGGSGMGAYHGKAGFLEFSHVKTVVGKPSFPDTLALAYPPYDRVRRTLIRLIMPHGGAGRRP